MHNVEREEAARFAERLQQACEQAGIPDERGRIAKIGRLAGVSHTAVRKWFNGEQIPSTERCILLARQLRVNASWLYSGQGDIRESDLSSDEWRLIKRYRCADQRGRYMINQVADLQASQPV